jgi:hypothetical protein
MTQLFKKIGDISEKDNVIFKNIHFLFLFSHFDKFLQQKNFAFNIGT